MIGTPSVFVQIWVDTNALTNGSTKGVYVVDNRVSAGSQNEGSTNLATAATNGSYVNWQVFNIDPTSTTPISIQSLSNSRAWGPSGQPQSDTTNGGFTGQLQETGNAPYSVTFNASKGGGSGITTTVNLSVVVS
jgi:hypothetical protein